MTERNELTARVSRLEEQLRVRKVVVMSSGTRRHGGASTVDSSTLL